MPAPIEPLVPDTSRQGRTAAVVGAGLATVGLTALVGLVTLLGRAFQMGSDLCHEQDEPLICTTGGQQLVFWTPVLSALAGLAVAVVGCWIWPRRHRPVWLIVGYLLAIVGTSVGYVIAIGNQQPS